MSDTLTAPDVGTDPKPSRKPVQTTLTDQQRSALSSAMSGYHSFMDRIENDRADVDALTPEPPKLTAPPKQQSATDPFQAFGQPAMFLAIFGSLLTRSHLTTAIQAMGGALKGTQEKDAAIAKQNYETWKIESANAMKMAKFTQDAYGAAIRKLGTDAAAGRAEFQTLTAAFKDDVMMQVYQTEGMPGVKKLLFARGKQAQAMGEGAAQVTQHVDNQEKIAAGLQSDDPAKQAEALNLYADTLTKTASQRKGTPAQQMQALATGVRMKAIASDLTSGDPARIAAAHTQAAQMAELGPGALKASATPKTTAAGAALQDAQAIANAKIAAAEQAAGRPLTEEEKAKIHAEARGEVKHTELSASAISNNAADFIAGELLRGNTQAAVGMARSQENIQKVDESLARQAEEKGMDPGDVAAATAAFHGLMAAARTTGTVGARIDIGAQELKSLIPQAREASEKVVRWGAVPIDKLRQALQGSTDDPDLADFALANQAVANAFAQVAARGGASTDSAREHAYSLLSIARSDTVYQRQLTRLTIEADAALHGTAAAEKDVLDKFTGHSAGARRTYKYTAAGPNGMTIHSDDGSDWFTPDGRPFGAP